MNRSSFSSGLLLVAVLSCIALATPVALLAGTRPDPGGIVLVVAPPWATTGGAAGIVSAAGGREIGPMRAPFAVLATLDDLPAARQHGAWLLLDGRVLARICGVDLPIERGAEDV